MKRLQLMVVVGAGLISFPAHADDFGAGSYVIPMDVDYQDEGMLRAYGLVYDLLRGGVPVRWVIHNGKGFGDPDFSIAATDFATGDAVAMHGYRGGPWVVDASDAAEAEPIIAAWQATYPETTVHEASEAFSGDVARYLVVAPTIAMFADGNEDIARDYMLSAAIPDSALDFDWPDESPDMLTVEEVSGPTETDHADGMLFDEDGDPVYCQFMSMHWGVGDAENNPEVVAEVRAYLNNPTHFFAECQAVNAFENLDPHGFFLTPNGFEFGDRPDEVDFYNADSPFGQLDGLFETVGGSEPSYTLPAGDQYKAGDIVMVTAAGTPEGVEDVWMTGFLDGQCPPDQHECGPYGKISYLGGHRYETASPMSANPDAQGARLFLNSLFEAPCATVEGLPNLAVAVDAPPQTDAPDVTLKITYVNTSFATALDVVLTDPLPAGATFMSANNGGTFANGAVTWDLGNLGPGEFGDLEIDVHLESFGIYDNSAQLDYRVGLSPLGLASNVSSTVYGDGSGSTSGGDTATGGPQTTSGSDSGTGVDTASATSDGDTDGGSGAGDSSGDSAGQGDASSSGCSCTTNAGSGTGPFGFLVVGFFALRRRRKIAAAGAALLLGACGSDGGTDASGTSGGVDTLDPSDSTPTQGSGPMKLDVASILDTPGVPEMGCQSIDFLFVIDSSESMKDHQANLISSFPGLAAEIRSAVPADDWHVMVVDTDGQWNGSDCANACATLGSCPDEPTFQCDTPPPALCDITLGGGEVAPYGEGASNATCLVSDRRYLDEGEADLEGTFACMAQVGVDGSSEEHTADALVRAVSPAMLEADGCNEGFVRDDAILVVTVITDEPDPVSEVEPPDWYDAVLAAKEGDPEAIVVLGLLPDGDAMDPVCSDPVAAPRLSEFTGLFPNSSRASVCEPDYSPFFAEAVDVILDTCADFVPPG